MLTVTDLHVTDLTALYSLFLFLEKECRNLNDATVCNIWSATIYQGIRDCLFNENKLLFSIRWISSDDEFFGFHRFANGRKWTNKCSRNCLYTCNSRTHVFWQSLFSCLSWSFSINICVTLDYAWRILEWIENSNTDKKNNMIKSMNRIIFPYLKMMKYLLNLFLGLSKEKDSYLRTLAHQLYG